MYEIYRRVDGKRDTLVEGVSEEQLPQVLRAMRLEFPDCVARRVL